MGAEGVLILPPAVARDHNEGRSDSEGPRSDVRDLAAVLGGRVLLPDSPAGLAGALERRTHRLGYWYQAWQAQRSDPAVIVSLSEKIGMCVSMLDAKTPHVVVAHNLTTPKRRAFQRVTRWLSRPDRVVVVSRPQEAYLRRELGIPHERVRLVHHHVDHRFFSPQGGPDEGYVLSVGQTGRDHRTLMEAVRASGLPTIVVASSRWIQSAGGPDVPALSSVTHRQGLSYQELRTLYDRASVVVVPLRQGLEWAAGVTGVLEAMAMAKPLVVSRTPGLEGYMEDGVDALCVPAGDPPALLAAVRDLMGDRSAANRLGAAGRRRVEAELTLDGYVARVASIVDELLRS